MPDLRALRTNGSGSPDMPQKMRLNPFQGSLDVIQGDVLHGWLYSPLTPAKPFVMAGSEPAVCIDDRIPRTDLQAALGVRDAFGFAAELPHMTGSETITLYAVTPSVVLPVASRVLATPVWEKRFLFQVARAKKIAAMPESVAVTCWDGAHNPLGRAMVLYDVIASKRPCVIFCYLHREFGGTLWPPLESTDLPLVTIPWEKRDYCHALLQRSGVFFGTVWICKPRLPSFRLASVISRPNTKLLLDCDDDEEALTDGESIPAEYNMPGTGLARELLAHIPARTVVSPSLKKRFGGEIVRHVRSGRPARERREKKAATPRKIGFFGTVREHKNILPITRALQSCSRELNIPLEFHVRGDMDPETCETLTRDGALVTAGMLQMRDLPDALAELDAVITGFPPAKKMADGDEKTELICKAQVSSKISDALASGIPVLTPDTPSIADIRNIPGVYPFNEDTFKDALKRALTHEGPISLPPDFTPEGAYKAFAKALEKADDARYLKALLPACTVESKGRKTLLLLWKQYDAGLYGRRVDQIARSYARTYPNHRVIVLEFFNQCPAGADNLSALSFVSERDIRGRLLEQKRLGLRKDGALYKTLFYQGPVDLRDALLSFLEHHDLTPENTTCVLFPIIQDYIAVEDILGMYPGLVDVVDNQVSWAGSDERRIFVNDQYFRLLKTHGTVLFNCRENMDYFLRHGFLTESNTASVIPNWYTLPNGRDITWKPQKKTPITLFYSGNMNDRIDWQLLRALAALPHIRLHLAGTAERILPDFLSLLSEKTIVYHGVTGEEETLSLLQSMDLAFIPHVRDEVSTYMDPMKRRMYEAVGIPTLCPASLAPEETSPLIIPYADQAQCIRILEQNKIIQKLEDIYQTGNAASPSLSKSHENETCYMQSIEHASSSTASKKSL